MQLVQDVGAGSSGFLGILRPGAAPHRWRPNDAEAARQVVAAARDAVAPANPGRPESAQWVLAADALNATNWPGLAVSALRQAEKTSPAVATTRGVQRLAADRRCALRRASRAGEHHDTVADSRRGQCTDRPESARHGERGSRFPTGGSTAASPCAQRLWTQPRWRRSESSRQRGGRTSIVGSGGGDSATRHSVSRRWSQVRAVTLPAIDARRSGRPIGRGRRHAAISSRLSASCA
jgi:hypothetical protein